MTKLFRLFVVVALVVMTSACGASVAPSSPSPMVVSTTGTLTAAPTTTVVGHPITVSWTASAGIRVDVCQSQCITLATAQTSGQAQHTPSASGEWRYVLYGVTQPDVNVRLAEARVTVSAQ